MKNSNFIVKVSDAKKMQIKKALEEAGITVRGVQEIFSEEIATDEEE